MRTMKVLLAFPSILLAIAAALGPSLPSVMMAVGVRSIPLLVFSSMQVATVILLAALDPRMGRVAIEMAVADPLAGPSIDLEMSAHLADLSR
jgi:hypothetical protein